MLATVPPSDNDRIALGRQALGARIRAMREASGISISEAASAADISYSYLSDVERGRRLPTLERLDSLARALEVTVVALLKDLYPWDSQRRPRSAPTIPDGRKHGTD